MKKTIPLIIIGLALILAICYIIPVRQRAFADVYSGDQRPRKHLEDFRKYPLKSTNHQNKDWLYLSTGEGDRTLLFLHGMGGAYDIWYQQIDQLKEDYHIISLTMPAVNSLAAATDGIEHILDIEHIDSVSIIGTSMGGYIGQYFMQRHPNRIDKMVLGNTFPPNQIYQEENGGLRKIVPLLPEWLIMSIFRDNVSKKVVPASENSELVKAYLLEQYHGLMSKKQFIGRFDMVLEQFGIQKNAAVNAIPKLIIESNNDPLVNPELRTNLKETYPDASVFSFDEKGHFPYLNQSEKYAEVLREFLQEPKLYPDELE